MEEWELAYSQTAPKAPRNKFKYATWSTNPEDPHQYVSSFCEYEYKNDWEASMHECGDYLDADNAFKFRMVMSGAGVPGGRKENVWTQFDFPSKAKCTGDPVTKFHAIVTEIADNDGFAGLCNNYYGGCLVDGNAIGRRRRRQFGTETTPSICLGEQGEGTAEQRKGLSTPFKGTAEKLELYVAKIKARDGSCPNANDVCSHPSLANQSELLSLNEISSRLGGCWVPPR